MIDVRLYYNQECYGLRNCLHCQNIIAFGIRSIKSRNNKKLNSRELSRIKKFIYQSVSRENFFCENALSMQDIREYLDKLITDQENLPIIDYDFGPDKNNK